METFYGDRAIPFTVCFQIYGKFIEINLTSEEIEICKSETIVPEGENCITENFEYLKKYEGEPRWTKTKSRPMIADYELKLLVQQGSSFDFWNILKHELN